MHECVELVIRVVMAEPTYLATSGRPTPRFSATSSSVNLHCSAAPRRVAFNILLPVYICSYDDTRKYKRPYDMLIS